MVAIADETAAVAPKIVLCSGLDMVNVCFPAGGQARPCRAGSSPQRSEQPSKIGYVN
jgi:hypothetical protein